MANLYSSWAIPHKSSAPDERQCLHIYSFRDSLLEYETAG